MNLLYTFGSYPELILISYDSFRDILDDRKAVNQQQRKPVLLAGCPSKFFFFSSLFFLCSWSCSLACRIEVFSCFFWRVSHISPCLKRS